MTVGNNYLPYGSAGTDEKVIIIDLAPPLTVTEAAKIGKKFIKELLAR